MDAPTRSAVLAMAAEIAALEGAGERLDAAIAGAGRHPAPNGRTQEQLLAERIGRAMEPLSVERQLEIANYARLHLIEALGRLTLPSKP